MKRRKRKTRGGRKEEQEEEEIYSRRKGEEFQLASIFPPKINSEGNRAMPTK